jgi:hypothetical protein
MLGPWIDFDKFGGLFAIVGPWEDFRKFGGLFLNLWTCVNFCKAQVCERCMDHGLIIIKLPERWLDQGRCRQTA